jgi:hypothetical protein
MQIKLKRLQARAARHLEAVAAARQAGMTWAEIGERLEMPGEAARKAFARAKAAMQSGRLTPLEQAPLPEPPDPPPSVTQSPRAAAPVRPVISPDAHRGETPAPIERKGFKRINLD